jgi:stage V sporulation protein B
MTGYFTAANRIGTLAIIEVAEQFCSMSVTMLTLSLWGNNEPGKACQCIIFGSGAGASLTLLCLVVLRFQENIKPGPPIQVRPRLAQAAIPLAMADIVKAGINTGENLMVPKRLKKNHQVKEPLAAFGTVSGMVFPVIMFPACILYALAELLIPELARCSAAESTARIQYLVRRSLKITMLYGLLFGGLMFLLAESLCLKLYNNSSAAYDLKLYALLIPMLYCDAIIDAMTKGLGQQKTCVQYNILTSALDVLLLFLLLPKLGMSGYFLSFLITHLINFSLSLRLLLRISNVSIPFYVPALSFSAAIAAVIGTSHIHGTVGQIFGYVALLGSILTLFQITGREDLQWISGLLNAKK